MEQHGIPTARAGTFAEAQPAKVFAEGLGGRIRRLARCKNCKYGVAENERFSFNSAVLEE